MTDPNPWMTYEDLKILRKRMEKSLFQEAYLNEWREESRPLYPTGRTLPGMQESWITSALENNVLRPLRSCASTILVKNPGGEIIRRRECGKDSIQPYVFTAWLSQLSGLIEALRTHNSFSSSLTSRYSPTPYHLGSGCEMCTFPTAQRCIGKTLFTTHAFKVLRRGSITVYVVMDVGISGPLILIENRLEKRA